MPDVCWVWKRHLAIHKCREDKAAQSGGQELPFRRVRTCELLLTLGPSGLETYVPEGLVRNEASLCVAEGRR